MTEGRFRLAFENAPIGMAVVDFEYRLRRVNNALCKELDFTAEELLQQRFVDITHADDIAREVLREIRKEDAKTVIIMFTADPSLALEELCLKEGASYYFCKTQMFELIGGFKELRSCRIRLPHKPGSDAV